MTHPFDPSAPDFVLLQQLGFATPTDIQRVAIPPLAEGRSLLALAPTGSGKTLAFLLPLMRRLRGDLAETQLLVLVPTRELGAQIAQVAETVARLFEEGRPLLVRTAFGGQKAETQKTEIAKRPAVVVATPGRALELLERDILCLDHLEAFVLDEADLMVGMGFEPEVARICAFLPARVQTAFFSATATELRSTLENRLLGRAVRIDLRSTKPESSSEPATQAQASTRHETLVVRPDQDKTGRFMALLREIAPRVETGIIFCQTREGVHTLCDALRRKGFSAEALSGELGQVERATILRRFKAGGVQYLVATNLASRGIDVKDLSVVLNFDLPSTAEEYVHRSGRSGRAGNSGWTVSLCSMRSLEFLRTMLEKVDLALEPYRVAQEAPAEPVAAVTARSFRKVHLNRGKSSKIRPGDVLGALTKELGFAREEVGSIFIFDHFTHVEVDESRLEEAMAGLTRKRMKNLSVRATLAAALAPVR